MKQFPISRQRAREMGRTRYWTGKPCKHGHIDWREVSSGTCCECNALWRAANGLKVAESRRNWVKANAEHVRNYQKEYRKS